MMGYGSWKETWDEVEMIEMLGRCCQIPEKRSQGVKPMIMTSNW